jgi:hypothetical protein
LIISKRIWTKCYSTFNMKWFSCNVLRLVHVRVLITFSKMFYPLITLYQTCTAFSCSLAPLILLEQNVFRRVVLKAQRQGDHKNSTFAVVSCLSTPKGRTFVRGMWGETCVSPNAEKCGTCCGTTAKYLPFPSSRQYLPFCSASLRCTYFHLFNVSPFCPALHNFSVSLQTFIHFSTLNLLS